MDGRGTFQKQPVGSGSAAAGALNTGLVMSPIFTETGGSNVRHPSPAATPQTIGSLPQFQGKYYPPTMPGANYSYLSGYMTSVPDAYKQSPSGSPGSLPLSQYWPPSEGYSRYLGNAVYSPYLSPMVSETPGSMYAPSMRPAQQPLAAYHKLYEADSHMQLSMPTPPHGAGIVSLPSSMATHSTLSSQKEREISNVKSSSQQSPASTKTKDSREKDSGKTVSNGKDKSCGSKSSENVQKQEAKRTDSNNAHNSGSKTERKNDKKLATNSEIIGTGTASTVTSPVSMAASSLSPSLNSSAGGGLPDTIVSKLNSVPKDEKMNEISSPALQHPLVLPHPALEADGRPVKASKKKDASGSERKRKSSKKKHDTPSEIVSQTMATVAKTSNLVTVAQSAVTMTSSAITLPSSSSSSSISTLTSSATNVVSEATVSTKTHSDSVVTTSVVSTSTKHSTSPSGHCHGNSLVSGQTVVQVSTPASLTITSHGAILATSSMPSLSSTTSSGYVCPFYPGYVSHTHPGHDREKDGHKVHATTFMPEVGTVASDLTVSSVSYSSNKSKECDKLTNSDSKIIKEERTSKESTNVPVSIATPMKNRTIENAVGKIVENALTPLQYLPSGNHGNQKSGRSSESVKSLKSSKSDRHEKQKKSSRGSNEHGKSKSDGVVKLDIPSMRQNERVLEYRDSRTDGHHILQQPPSLPHSELTPSQDVPKEAVKIQDSSQFRDIIHDHSQQGRNVTLVDNTPSVSIGERTQNVGHSSYMDLETQRRMMEWNQHVAAQHVASQHGYYYHLPEHRYTESDSIKADGRQQSIRDASEADSGDSRKNGQKSNEENLQHCRNVKTVVANRTKVLQEDPEQHSGSHRNKANHSKPNNNKISKHCDNSKSSSRSSNTNEKGQSMTSAQASFMPPPPSEYSPMNFYPGNKVGDGRYPPVGIAVAQQRHEREGEAAQMSLSSSIPTQSPKLSTQKRPSPSTTPSQRPQQPSPVSLPSSQQHSRPSSGASNKECTSTMTPSVRPDNSDESDKDENRHSSPEKSHHSSEKSHQTSDRSRPPSERSHPASSERSHTSERLPASSERPHGHLPHHSIDHDNEREQFLREQRDMYMKPPSASHMLGELSSNLIVTGGGTLPPGVHQWEGTEAAAAAAQQAHLAATAAHWLPRAAATNGTPLWLTHPPYGHPSLHHGSMDGASTPHGHVQLPHTGLLARDPATGQIVIIPSEHAGLEILDRQSLWPYTSPSPHLQPHGHQLQQLMLNQHQYSPLQHQQILQRQEQQQRSMELAWQQQQQQASMLQQQASFYKQAQRYQEEQQQKQKQKQQQEAREAEERQERESQAAAAAAAAASAAALAAASSAHNDKSAAESERSVEKEKSSDDEKPKVEEDRKDNVSSQHPYFPTMPIAGQPHYSFLYPPTPQYFYDHPAGAFNVPTTTSNVSMVKPAVSTSSSSSSPSATTVTTSEVTITKSSVLVSSKTEVTSLRSTSVQTVTPPAEHNTVTEIDGKRTDVIKTIETITKETKKMEDKAIVVDSPIDVVNDVPPSPLLPQQPQSPPSPPPSVVPQQQSLGTMTELVSSEEYKEEEFVEDEEDEKEIKSEHSEYVEPMIEKKPDLETLLKPADPVSLKYTSTVEDLSEYASSLIALKKSELTELNRPPPSPSPSSCSSPSPCPSPPVTEKSAIYEMTETENKMAALVPKMDLSMETFDLIKKEKMVSDDMATVHSVLSRTHGIDAAQLEAIEGIALLSEAAVHQSLHTMVEDKYERKTEMSKGHDLTDGRYHGNEFTDLNANHYSSSCQQISSSSSSSEFVIKTKSKVSVTIREESLGKTVCSGLKLPIGTDGMDAMELEMRMKLAELQRKYREKQKELARLQRKKDRDHKSDDKNSSPVKRGPGRPRKRKFSAVHQKLSPSKSTNSLEDLERSVKSKLGKNRILDPSLPIEPPPPKKRKKASKDSERKSSKDSSSSFTGDKAEKPKKKKSKSLLEKASKMAAAGGIQSEIISKIKVKTSSSSPSKSKKSSKSNIDLLTSTDSINKTPKVKKSKSTSPDDAHIKVLKEKKKDSESGNKNKNKTTKSKGRGRPKLICTKLTCSPPDIDSLDILNLGDMETEPFPVDISKCLETTPKKPKEGKEKKRSKDKAKANKLKKKAQAEVDCHGDAAVKSRSDRYDDIIEDVVTRYSKIKTETPEVVQRSMDIYDESNIELDEMAMDGLGLLTKYATAASPKVCAKRKRHSSGKESECSTSDVEVKKRKPGRPKKSVSPARVEDVQGKVGESSSKKTTTSKPKSPKPVTNESREEKPKKSKKKKSKEEEIAKAFKEYVNTERSSYLEHERIWQRRRSERIFLSDTSPVPSRDVSPINKSSLPKSGQENISSRSHKDDETPPTITPPKKAKKSSSSTSKGKSVSTPEFPPNVDDYAMPLSPAMIKKKPSKSSGKDTDTPGSKKSKVKCKKKIDSDATVSAKPKSMHEHSLQDDDIYSNDGYGSEDGENIPLSSLVERPITPEPRSCTIVPEELVDGLRVLIPSEGLFYTGHINAIQAPDIYGVVIDGERGNRPHVYSQEQILQEAIHDVKPGSTHYLPEGTRVCAYWSQQYRCLYPGCVSKGSPNPDIDDKLINVEFDDGDSGRIPLDHIRLLSQDYPIVDIEPSPIMPQRKRRRRTSGDISSDGRDSTSRMSGYFETSLGVLDTKESGTSSTSKEHSKKTKSRGRKSKKEMLEEYDFLDTISEVDMENDVFIDDYKPPEKVKSPNISKSSHGDSAKSAKKSEKKMKNKDRDRSDSKESKKKSKQDSKKEKISKKLSRQNSKSPSKGEGTQSDSMENSQPSSKSKKSGKHSELKGQNKDKAKTRLKEKKIKKSSKIKSDSEDTDSSSTKKHKKHKHSKDRDKKDKESRTNVANDDTVFSPPLQPPKKKPDLTVCVKTNDLNVPEESQSDSTAEDVDVRSCSEGLDSTETTPMTSTQTSDNDGELTDEDTTNSDSTSEVSSDLSAEIKKSSKSAIAAKRGRKTRLPSASKIAAFLPSRQLWRWCGKATQRRGMKGKAKKVFYKAICRDKEIIRVNDCAVFLSTGRPHLPYVGRIESMWEAWGGNMVVKVKWFYHPEETKAGRRGNDGKMALYQSPHVDENDVQTISHRCEVLSFEDYQERTVTTNGNSTTTTSTKDKSKSNVDNDDVYYLAGTYDPATGMQVDEL
ncbi:uncharacterized protein LOC100369237 [Saccoglossus kowalevskii]|uniref:Trinucleotide repeat-containing gene 18 protein-like n=1 Tax=Saccoglossus kowalevskii TaxID=10224 RepID=A0ABM0GVX9_SACKO|nr:PREDICTED: trinucleotide repeat-containing gene 18 protein-like [Saccoglossus kowalevskii]